MKPGSVRLFPPADNLAEDAMTDSGRPVCDCPEPCACYAEGYVHGKEKAHFEVRAVLDSNHDVGCGCEPCKTVREVINRKLMVDSASGLFQQIET